MWVFAIQKTISTKMSLKCCTIIDHHKELEFAFFFKALLKDEII